MEKGCDSVDEVNDYSYVRYPVSYENNMMKGYKDYDYFIADLESIRQSEDITFDFLRVTIHISRIICRDNFIYYHQDENSFEVVEFPIEVIERAVASQILEKNPFQFYGSEFMVIFPNDSLTIFYDDDYDILLLGLNKFFTEKVDDLLLRNLGAIRVSQFRDSKLAKFIHSNVITKLERLYGSDPQEKSNLE